MLLSFMYGRKYSFFSIGKKYEYGIVMIDIQKMIVWKKILPGDFFEKPTRVGGIKFDGQIEGVRSCSSQLTS